MSALFPVSPLQYTILNTLAQPLFIVAICNLFLHWSNLELAARPVLVLDLYLCWNAYMSLKEETSTEEAKSLCPQVRRRRRSRRRFMMKSSLSLQNNPKLQNECGLEIECLLGLRGVVGGTTISVASPSTEAPSEDRGPQDQSLAGFPSNWLDAVPKVGRRGHIDLRLMHFNLLRGLHPPFVRFALLPQRQP